MDNRKRAQKIIELLINEHPNARTAISFRNPLELLVATILSAQSTDKIVNKVTESLFKKYLKAEDYGNADLQELEKDIRSTGFYHVKAKYLKKMGQMLSSKFDSKVPTSIDELVTLPGVGRKTANIVLSNAFGVIEGVAIDTHVRRLTQRLQLSKKKTPDKIESDLMKLLPKEQWSLITDLLIFHGRRVCTARNPNCTECALSRLCPSASTFK